MVRHPPVRFCNSRDGVRIAYSVAGRGQPLVMLSGGHSHLELDAAGPVLGHWIEALGRDHTLVRLDTRGYGLSDRNVADHSIDAVAADVQAVVDAAGVDRFTLFAWLGGTPFAVTLASRMPQRVSRLVLHAAYLRGWLKRGLGPQEREVVEGLIKQVESGWDMADPIVRHAITSSFIPDSSAAQQAWFNDAMRASVLGVDAARRLRVRLESDVTALAPSIQCPAIVLNSRHDTNPPFEEGRLAASLVPGSQFVALPSRNHVLLPHEPAWQRWQEEVGAFLRRSPAPSFAFETLTTREQDLLHLVADGLDNAQIAVRLGISEKTVRNHLTNVYAKLGVENRAQAIVLAHRGKAGQPS